MLLSLSGFLNFVRSVSGSLVKSIIVLGSLKPGLISFENQGVRSMYLRLCCGSVSTLVLCWVDACGYFQWDAPTHARLLFDPLSCLGSSNQRIVSSSKTSTYTRQQLGHQVTKLCLTSAAASSTFRPSATS